TGWDRLGAVLAIAVGLHILATGHQLIRRSINGLLDAAISDEDLNTVKKSLNAYQMEEGIMTHAIRTRQAGRRRFISMHVLAPGSWTGTPGQDLAAELEAEIRHSSPGTTVFTHLEPIEQPQSWNDTGLDG